MNKSPLLRFTPLNWFMFVFLLRKHFAIHLHEIPRIRKKIPKTDTTTKNAPRQPYNAPHDANSDSIVIIINVVLDFEVDHLVRSTTMRTRSSRCSLKVTDFSEFGVF